VLYVGERSVALLPQESEARARAVQWLVAALNSIVALRVEPGVDRHTLRQRGMGQAARAGRAAVRPPALVPILQLAGEKPYLDGNRFTAGDLIGDKAD